MYNLMENKEYKELILFSKYFRQIKRFLMKIYAILY